MGSPNGLPAYTPYTLTTTPPLSFNSSPISKYILITKWKLALEFSNIFITKWTSFNNKTRSSIVYSEQGKMKDLLSSLPKGFVAEALALTSPRDVSG
ncbi:hypothetical protein Hanom_Chr09g00843561 [Helianthus anomalus]